MTATYDLIFSGDIDDTLDEARVRKNVAALFKANPVQVEKLFSGKTVVLKSGLEETAAKKYLAALRKAGALCKLRPCQTDTHQQTTTKPVQQKEPEPESERATEPDTNLTTTQIDANASSMTVAPVGADMQDKKTESNHEAPDTDHINLRPQSGYLVDPSDNEPPPAPDTSHITLNPQ